MTPFYLQTDTEAGMWSALTEMGFVSEHEAELVASVEDGSYTESMLDEGWP